MNWSALEPLVGLCAVPASWRRALGEDWAWARHLLRPTDQLAESYPKLDEDAWSFSDYVVVCHDEAADRYVGVCPDGTGKIPLGRADLLVYELDMAVVSDRVCQALGLTCQPAQHDELPPGCWLAGTSAVRGHGDVPVYLLVLHELEHLDEAIGRLLVQHKRFVILTSSPAVRPHRTRRALIAKLEDVLNVDEHGVMSASVGWSALLRPLQRRRDGSTGDVSPDGVLRYLGRTYQCGILSPRQQAFLQAGLTSSVLPLRSVANRHNGLLVRRHPNATGARNAVSSALKRINQILVDAGVPIWFHLARHQDVVLRTDPAPTRPTAARRDSARGA